jgi:hypothetical protein
MPCGCSERFACAGSWPRSNNSGVVDSALPCALIAQVAFCEKRRIRSDPRYNVYTAELIVKEVEIVVELAMKAITSHAEAYPEEADPRRRARRE